MKKLFCKLLMAAAVCIPATTHATTIDFESGLDPFFNYSSVDVSTSLFPFDSGYLRMQNHTDSLGFAYNPNAESPSTFTAARNFDLISFLMDGAWGSQTLTINGLLDGNIKYTEQVLINTLPELVTLNWIGVDEFTISIGDDFSPDEALDAAGQHWVMDNIVISENAAPVSEPGTLALIGLGMLGFAAFRRKNAQSLNV